MNRNRPYAQRRQSIGLTAVLIVVAFVVAVTLGTIVRDALDEVSTVLDPIEETGRG